MGTVGLYDERRVQARGDPAVKEAEKFVIETSLKKGVAPRIELEALDGVEYYLNLGVKHFRIGNDVSVLRRFWQENGTKLKDMLSKA